MTVTEGRSQWEYDSESEFFAACGRSMQEVSYSETARLESDEFDDKRKFDYRSLMNMHGQQIASVSIQSPDRGEIEAVTAVFARHAEASRINKDVATAPATSDTPTVFIGHGRNPAWRDLKDHLADKHGLSVEAYEVGARAGHAVRDILSSMLTKSSIALIVMTGEDRAEDGLRPRQNVVHEAGLFQGRLGFERALVLMEDGVESFSNLDGLDVIRFPEGNIKSTFGDVLATIKREFPS